MQTGAKMKSSNADVKPREHTAEKRGAIDPFDAIHPQVCAPRRRQVASDSEFGGPMTMAEMPAQRQHAKPGTIILTKRK